MSLLEQISRPPWPWQEAAWRRLEMQRQAGATAHAYLFIGDRGTGRTGFAREFANFLLCDGPVAGRACYRCRSCKAGGADHHPDLRVILPEEGKKDIGIGRIRELTEFLNLNSFAGSGRVAIIPGAEALTRSASNALLKTLEEPAAGATLLLTAYSPGGLLPTIRSRCQLLGLPAPSSDAAVAWLREHLPEDADTTDAQLRELLEAYGNRPLELMPLLNMGHPPVLNMGHPSANKGKNMEHPSNFIVLRNLLLGLLEDRISVLRAAEQAVKIGETEVFEQLSRVSTILIRGLVNGDLLGKENQALAAALPQAGALVFLLEFHRRVSGARKLLAGPGNPNPQLLLESTFRLWRGREPRPMG